MSFGMCFTVGEAIAFLAIEWRLFTFWYRLEFSGYLFVVVVHSASGSLGASVSKFRSTLSSSLSFSSAHSTSLISAFLA